MAPKIMQKVVFNTYNYPKVFPAQSHDGALQLWECPPVWRIKSICRPFHLQTLAMVAIVSTVVTHDDLTKQGFSGLSHHFWFYKIDFVKSRNMHGFFDREEFPLETGSFAPLRGLKRLGMLYQTYIVHSHSRSGCLQSNISKTLV
jgi:hypothetical protein